MQALRLGVGGTGLLFSVAGPDTRKSPPKKMGSAVTRKRFKSSPVPSTGAEGAAGGSEQGLRAWSRPAGGYGALVTLEELTPCLVLRKKQSQLRALSSETDRARNWGGRSFRGSLLYWGRCRRASQRREQGHRGPQEEGETFVATGPLGTPSASEKPAVLPEWRKACLGAEGHKSAMGPWARVFSSGSGLPRRPRSLSPAQPRSLSQHTMQDRGAAWPQLLLCTQRARPVGEAVAPGHLSSAGSGSSGGGTEGSRRELAWAPGIRTPWSRLAHSRFQGARLSPRKSGPSCVSAPRSLWDAQSPA